jgi:hypothetical protein
MNEIMRVDGNRLWTSIVGYSRVLRMENFVEASRLMLPELCVEFEATLWMP